MENFMDDEGKITARDKDEFIEFKKSKRLEELKAKVAKIECDCLSPNIERAYLKQQCKDCNRLGIGGIVVFPSLVKACVSFLGNDPVTALIAVISYPHGGDVTQVKCAAVKRAIKDGIDEVEVSAPLAYIKEGNFSYFKKECKKLKKAAKSRAVRVVFDVPSLAEAQLLKACQVAADAGINCIRLDGDYDMQIVKKVKSCVKDKCLLKLDKIETVGALDNAVDFGAAIITGNRALALAQSLLAQV